jgi:hypothetical protein
VDFGIVGLFVFCNAGSVQLLPHVGLVKHINSACTGAGVNFFYFARRVDGDID